MNTVITITVIPDTQYSTIDIQNGIEAAFGEFDRIVKRFTRFNRSSELAHLNRNHGKWYTVSAEMIDLVDMMLQLAEASDGAFDPTIIDFLEAYGYDSKYDFSRLGSAELSEQIVQLAESRPSWRELQLDKDNRRIKLAPNQRIDLGGIGKGYAIDCAAKHLAKFGNYSINAGGDIRVTGHNHLGKPWEIALKHQLPREEQDQDNKEVLVGKIHSTNTALASSGSWARKVKNFHHIINPSSGEPSSEMVTVFVTADSAALADGWATALFVGGKELLAKTDANIETLMLGSQNQVFRTKGFKLD